MLNREATFVNVTVSDHSLTQSMTFRTQSALLYNVDSNHNHSVNDTTSSYQIKRMLLSFSCNNRLVPTLYNKFIGILLTLYRYNWGEGGLRGRGGSDTSVWRGSGRWNCNSLFCMCILILKHRSEML